MISLEDARELLLGKTKKMTYEEVHIEDALGRVLYEDIYSEIDNPPFPRSPLDGYAVKGNDTKGASNENPISLSDRIIGFLQHIEYFASVVVRRVNV